jgi:hypothetical protein
METVTVKCSHCKKKYKTNEETFDVYFGYKNKQDEPFKTCFKCRSKGKPKTNCDRCGLEILPEEQHIHNEGVYCRKVAVERHKATCTVCSKTAICALAWCISANYQDGVKRYTEHPEQNISQQPNQERRAVHVKKISHENYDSD